MKFAEWWKNDNPLAGTHVGYVADNKDPRMQGRLRVWIAGLLDDPEREENTNQEKTSNDLTVEKLPWYLPMQVQGERIPDIGEPVLVMFHQNSIYHGMFLTGVNELVSRHPDVMSEYPNRYGTRDNSGKSTTVNQHPDILSEETTYPDGTYVLNDSKHGLTLMLDPYGTTLEVDRSSQRAMLKLGDSVVTITPDGIALHAKHLTLSGSESLTLQSNNALIKNAPDE